MSVDVSHNLLTSENPRFISAGVFVYNIEMSNLQIRMCDQKGCDLPATTYLVWIEPMCLCGFHAAQMVGTGDAMGFPTPRATRRPLEPHERVMESLITQED